MKFQTLVTVTVTMTTLVTPSSADGLSCASCRFDVNSGACSGCRTVFKPTSGFPTDLRSLSLEGDDASVGTVRLDYWDFEQFPELESLSLSRMLISWTGQCSLCLLPLLRSVALDNATVVERLPPKLLSGSSKLQEFGATGCGLSNVPEELFAGTPDLRMVDLSGNRLTSVPRGLFLGGTNLRSVDLSGNQLTSLPTGIFSVNGNLRKVSLAGNRLTELPLGLFDWNPRLEEVWLDHNALTSLPEGLFLRESLFANSTLSLEGNPLSCDSRLQSVVTRLERLDWTVRLPQGWEDDVEYANCTAPSYSSSSPEVVVTRSLYLGVVGWTIWWQVAKGLLDT